MPTEGAGTGPDRPTDEHPGLTGVYFGLAGLAVIAILVVAIEPLHQAAGDAIRGDTTALREELRGVGGVVLVLAVALVHSVLFYPAEILDAAAGYVYGFWLGLLLTMTGWILNALVSYWLGRHAARPLLHRLFGAARFERYEGMVERGGVALLLAMRLIPIVPFSLFSYAAGTARVPLGTFVWTTAIGYIPITAVFVYFGSRLDVLSLEDPLLWIGAAVLITLLLLSRRLIPTIRGERA